MTSINNVIMPTQAKSVNQKQKKSQTPLNFKAGQDEFVRSAQVKQSDLAKIMAERQKAEKKAKRKRRWKDGLQVVALLSSIALAAVFIWNLTKGADMGKSKKELSKIWEDLTKADSIDDMALPKNLKEIVKTIKSNATDGKLISEKGGKPINSILLYGPPGTGKTTFAKAIAKMFPEAKFASLDVTSLGSEFSSVTERNINNAVDLICKEARENPTKKFFVFIDEIDSVMMVDSGFGAKHSNDILNEFKKCFTEKLGKCENIITIGATNLPIDVEKGIILGGKALDKPMLDRFAEKILVDLPTAEQIQNAIAKHYTGRRLVDDALKDPSKLKEFAEHLVKGKDVSFREIGYLFNKAAALTEGETKVTIKELAKAVLEKKEQLKLPKESLEWFIQQAA